MSLIALFEVQITGLVSGLAAIEKEKLPGLVDVMITSGGVVPLIPECMRVHVWAHVHQAVAHSKHARNTLAKNALYSFEFSHTTRSLDVDTMFYIGGVEPHVSLPPFSLSLPHFDGCLSNLTMDDRIVDLASPVRQHGTSEGCPPLERDCPVASCLRGDCVSVWNGTICHCEESPECGAAVQSSVSLSNGHVGLELPPGSAFTVETFSLAFRTRQATATLISFGSVASVKVHTHYTYLFIHCV